MKYSKLKIVIFCVWLIGIMGLIFVQKSGTVNAESLLSIPKPEIKEVEKFNFSILNRFLTIDGQGMRRIGPPNPHFERFEPLNDDEKKSVKYFEDKNWKVGIYLIGRKLGYPYSRKHLNSYYHANPPVAVTNNLKAEDLPNVESFFTNAANAFNIFQDNSSKNDRGLEFDSDGWWYIAKPVRAAKESCIECHREYVPVKSGNQYSFRERKIGDVNGVLVYAFQKVKK